METLFWAIIGVLTLLTGGGAIAAMVAMATPTKRD